MESRYRSNCQISVNRMGEYFRTLASNFCIFFLPFTHLIKLAKFLKSSLFLCCKAKQKFKYLITLSYFIEVKKTSGDTTPHVHEIPKADSEMHYSPQPEQPPQHYFALYGRKLRLFGLRLLFPVTLPKR